MTSGVPTTNIAPVQHGKLAIMPYIRTMHSTHKGLQKLNGISDGARTAHVLLTFTSGALISVGKFCDNGCDMKINSGHLNIYEKGKHLMTVPRKI